MVLIQYYNLLIAYNLSTPTEFEVIGEDSNASLDSNEAISALNADDLLTYNAKLAAVVKLVCTYKSLSRLPHGTSFTSLTSIDVNKCVHVTSLPASWNVNNTVNSINASYTQIASIPTELSSSLTQLRVEGCRNITSVNAAGIKRLIVSHSTIRELVSPTSLVSLFATNSRLAVVSSQTLRVMSWSSALGESLNVSPVCTSLLEIISDAESAIVVPSDLSDCSVARFQYLS